MDKTGPSPGASHVCAEIGCGIAGNIDGALQRLFWHCPGGWRCSGRGTFLGYDKHKQDSLLPQSHTAGFEYFLQAKAVLFCPIRSPQLPRGERYCQQCYQHILAALMPAGFPPGTAHYFVASISSQGFKHPWKAQSWSKQKNQLEFKHPLCLQHPHCTDEIPLE